MQKSSLRSTAVAACLAAFLFTSPPAHAASQQVATHGNPVQVVRDAYGVPHLFGQTSADVFEAYGYVVAQDRLWQLELNRRASRGRLSEVLGAGYLQADRLMRLTGYTQDELEAQLEALPAEIVTGLKAYANGINRYLGEVQADPNGKLPYEFHQLNFWPDAWEATDSVAFGAFMLRRFGEIGGREVGNYALLQRLIGNLGEVQAHAVFNDFMWRNDPAAPVTVPANFTEAPRPENMSTAATLPHYGPLTEVFPSLEDAKSLWGALGVPSKLGSYAWAVRPENSADGVAMLFGGPQMSWSTPEVVHEVQLTTQDGLHVEGMAFAGVPLVLIGRNAHVAWTSTTAVGDNVDYYYEFLCDAGVGPQSGTLFKGKCVPLHKRTEMIAVRGADPVPYEVVRSVHGPAVLIQDQNSALAQKRAHWQREAQSFVGFAMFNTAHNIDEFAAGVPHLVTAHNFLYVDRKGNIGYWQAGEVPVRAAGFDFRLPLPGDGQAEWTGDTLPIPSSVNPTQGYLANWNNKPAADYDSADSRYFGKQWRLLDLQARLSGQKISWQGMHDIAEDIARVDQQGRESRYLLPLFLKGVQASGSLTPAAMQALALLQNYTGDAFANAVQSPDLLPGFLLFSSWKDAILHRLFDPVVAGALPDSATNVLIHVLEQHYNGQTSLTPQYDYLQGQDANALIATALLDSIGEITDALGSNPNGWVFPRPTIEFDHPILGHIASMPLSNRATYAQIVRAAPEGITGESIFSLGQSGFAAYQGPGKFVLDPHFADLLPLYRAFQYKPMELLSRTSSN